MTLYPIKFDPLYKDYIWGGRNLEKIGKVLPDSGIVAESWEIANHRDGDSIISNGFLAGKTLTEALNMYRDEILGTAPEVSSFTEFPLIIKFIDAQQQLSIQVHPDDQYAALYENGGKGKTEMWYIISAQPDAELVFGLCEGIDKKTFSDMTASGKICDALNTVKVKAGDFINIPAGTIHAIGAGIMLAEVQQNSNSTYRVYDFDRVDDKGNKRVLHIDKAMDVINFSCSNFGCRKGLEYLSTPSYRLTFIAATKYYAVEKLELSGEISFAADYNRFNLFVVPEGSCTLQYDGGVLNIKSGETVLVPAALNNYTLDGTCTLLQAYVPNIDSDVYDKLSLHGYSRNDAQENIAGLNEY